MPILDKLRNKFSSNKSKTQSVVQLATTSYKNLKHIPDYGIVGVSFNLRGTDKVLKVLTEPELTNPETYKMMQKALDEKKIDTLIAGSQGYIAFTRTMMDENKFVNSDVDIAELVKIHYDDAEDDTDMVGIIMTEYDLPEELPYGVADYIKNCYEIMESVEENDWNADVVSDYNIGRNTSKNKYQLIDWFL